MAVLRPEDTQGIREGSVSIFYTDLITIIIPCHRVLASAGKTGGFSDRGGVETKLALLRHEGALLLWSFWRGLGSSKIR